MRVPLKRPKQVGVSSAGAPAGISSFQQRSAESPVGARAAAPSAGLELQNIRVIVRCRPINDAEREEKGAYTSIKCDTAQRTVTVSVNKGTTGRQRRKSETESVQSSKAFKFDGVCNEFSSQTELFQRHVEPTLDDVLEGFNCTLFAYGQTGTGKTFTMEGDLGWSLEGGLSKDAGIIPRCVSEMFRKLAASGEGIEWSMKCSYLEIYNEELCDLLEEFVPSHERTAQVGRNGLRIFEGGGSASGEARDLMKNRGLAVTNLTEVSVVDISDIFKILEWTSAKRKTAETLLNKRSSRSHCIFTICLHIKDAIKAGAGGPDEDVFKVGKLNLVDLAGSENIQRSGALNHQVRSKEVGIINQSLLTLGRVITALSERQSYVPYRDSKLTRLLQESLGGRTKTAIFATVSPSSLWLEETLSTLEYAHRAKDIKNKPEVNAKAYKTTIMKDLNSEIDRLRCELGAARVKEGVHLPLEMYENMVQREKALADEVDVLGSEVRSRCEEAESSRKRLEYTEEDLRRTRRIVDLQKSKLERGDREVTEAQGVGMRQSVNLSNNKMLMRSVKDELKHAEGREKKLLSWVKILMEAASVSLSIRDEQKGAAARGLSVDRQTLLVVRDGLKADNGVEHSLAQLQLRGQIEYEQDVERLLQAKLLPGQAYVDLKKLLDTTVQEYGRKMEALADGGIGIDRLQETVGTFTASQAVKERDAAAVFCALGTSVDAIYNSTADARRDVISEEFELQNVAVGEAMSAFVKCKCEEEVRPLVSGVSDISKLAQEVFNRGGVVAEEEREAQQEFKSSIEKETIQFRAKIEEDMKRFMGEVESQVNEFKNSVIDGLIVTSEKASQKRIQFFSNAMAELQGVIARLQSGELQIVKRDSETSTASRWVSEVNIAAAEIQASSVIQLRKAIDELENEGRKQITSQTSALIEAAEAVANANTAGGKSLKHDVDEIIEKELRSGVFRRLHVGLAAVGIQNRKCVDVVSSAERESEEFRKVSEDKRRSVMEKTKDIYRTIEVGLGLIEKQIESGLKQNERAEKENEVLGIDDRVISLLANLQDARLTEEPPKGCQIEASEALWSALILALNEGETPLPPLGRGVSEICIADDETQTSLLLGSEWLKERGLKMQFSDKAWITLRDIVLGRTLGRCSRQPSPVEPSSRVASPGQSPSISPPSLSPQRPSTGICRNTVELCFESRLALALLSRSGESKLHEAMLRAVLDIGDDEGLTLLKQEDNLSNAWRELNCKWEISANELLAAVRPELDCDTPAAADIPKECEENNAPLASPPRRKASRYGTPEKEIRSTRVARSKSPGMKSKSAQYFNV